MRNGSAFCLSLMFALVASLFPSMARAHGGYDVWFYAIGIIHLITTLVVSGAMTLALSHAGSRKRIVFLKTALLVFLLAPGVIFLLLVLPIIGDWGVVVIYFSLMPALAALAVRLLSRKRAD